MLEKVMLIGNLTGDPELRYTPTNQAVANCGLATDASYTDSNGTRVKRTKFWRITAWGKLGENLVAYKHKGDAIYVEGDITAKFVTGKNGELQCNGPEVWTAQDGSSRASFEVTAQVIKYLPSKRQADQPDAATAATPVTASTVDDGIPF